MPTTYSKILCVTRLGALALCAALLLPACASAPHPSAASDTHDAELDASGERPPTAKTLYTLAHILINQHRDAEAEQLLHAALKESSTYAPAYAALAELQMGRGSVDTALETLNKGIAATPREAILHNNDQGMCYVSKGDYASSLASFTRAVELEATTARYRANRAMAMGMLGKYEECLSAYATVVSWADAHYNLAVICKMRGDAERSQVEFAVAQQLRSEQMAEPAKTPAARGNSDTAGDIAAQVVVQRNP